MFVQKQGSKAKDKHIIMPAPRNAPILHVVYAGRGDAFYVEYESANNERKLFVMDAGPRTSGGWNPRPYFQFFMSAGRHIWHSQMGKAINAPLELEAVVCSHQHSDHVEGVYDLMRQPEALLTLNSGVVTPQFDDTSGTMSTLHKEMCADGRPRMQFDPTVRWNAETFTGGIIEYPLQVFRKDGTLDLISPDPIMLLTRPPVNPPPYAITKAQLETNVRRIGTYTALSGITLNAERTTRNDLNFSSLVIHVPETPDGGPLNNGIYLTGDNNANIISHFMKQAVGQLLAPDKRRHFGIYKIQHHGGRDDTQLTEQNATLARQLNAVPVEVAGEFTLLLTLVAVHNPFDDLLSEAAQDCAAANVGRPGLTQLVNWMMTRKNRSWTDGDVHTIRELLLARQVLYRQQIVLGRVLQYFDTVLTDPDDRNRTFFNPYEEWSELVKCVKNLKTDPERDMFYTVNKVERPSRRGNRDDTANDPGLPRPSWSGDDDDDVQQQGTLTKTLKKLKMDGTGPQGHTYNTVRQQQSDTATIMYKTFETVENRGWWAKWWRGPQGSSSTGFAYDLLKTARRIRDIGKFFASFTADAYVVNANFQDKSHPHPHPETLCGLGFALSQEYRPATLYLTNPQSFKLQEFNRLCLYLGLDAHNILTEYLFIRYPRVKHTMSLTANPTVYNGVTHNNNVYCWPETDDFDKSYPQNLFDLDRVEPKTDRTDGDGEPGTYPIPTSLLDEEFTAFAKERNNKLEDAQKWNVLLPHLGRLFTISTLDLVSPKFIVLDLNGAIKLSSGSRTLLIHESWEGINNDDTNLLYLSRPLGPVNQTSNLTPITLRVADAASQLYYVFWKIGKKRMSAFRSGSDLEIKKDSIFDRVPFKFTPVDPSTLALQSASANIMNSMPMNMMMLTTQSTSLISSETMMPIRQDRQVSAVNEEAESKTKLTLLPAEDAARASSDAVVSQAVIIDEPDTGAMKAVHADDAVSTTIGEGSTTNGTADHEVEEDINGSPDLKFTKDDHLQHDPNLKHVVSPGGGESATPPKTDLTKRSTFDLYFAAARLKKENNLTAIELLANMVTAANYQNLGFSRAREQQVLGFKVDYDKDNSWIEFTDNGLNVTANKALLQLLLPENAVLGLAGDPAAPVVDAKLLLDWAVDNTLRIGMTVTTRESMMDLDSVNELRMVKVLRNPKGPSLLSKALRAMKYTDEAIDNMSVLQALGAVLGAAEDAVDMMFRRIPTALAIVKGFVDLKPDWITSTGVASYTATQSVHIKQVRIICDLKGAPAVQTSLSNGVSFGPFSIKPKSIDILVENARMASEQVTLIAMVTFAMKDQAAIDLQMAVLLSSRAPSIDMIFLLGKAKGIDDIVKTLGSRTANIKKIEVPLGDGTVDGNKSQLLEKLNPTEGTVGFVLRQPMRYTSVVQLDRIFFSTDLNSWRDKLPVTFPKSLTNFDVQVTVLSPLSAKARRARVDVSFDWSLKVQDNSERKVTTSLSIIPLVQKHEFECRLDIDAADTGLSLSEIVHAIGLGDVVSDVAKDFPFFKKALEGIYIRSISAGIISEGGQQRFGDWNISLWLPKFELIPGIVLEDVSIGLRKIGSITVIVSAAIQFTDTSKVAVLDIKSPTLSSNGHIWLDVSDGISMKTILQGLKLGTYDDVPVVGEVLQTELQHMEVVLATSTEKAIIIDGFSIKLHHPSVKIGPLEFTDVVFQFTTTNEASLNLSGKEEKTNQRTIEIQAQIFESDLAADVNYSSGDNSLSASIIPLNPTSIGRMLRACLPTGFPVSDALMAVVDDLQLKGSSIAFATSKGLDLRHFDFHVQDETTIEVRRLVLRELEVVYNVTERNKALPSSQEPSTDDSAAASTPPSTDVTTTFDSSVVKKEDAAATSDDGFDKTLNVLAIIEKGQVKAKFVLHSKTNNDSKLLSMGIYPTKKGSISLGGFLSLFDWDESKIEYVHPEKRPTIFSLIAVEGDLIRDDSPQEGTSPSLVNGEQSTGTQGSQVTESATATQEQDSGTQVSPVQQKKNTKMELNTFHFAAETDQHIAVLERPLIEILKIFLDIKYDKTKIVVSKDPKVARSGLSGVLYGAIKIGKLHLKMMYQYDAETQETAFYAEANLAELLDLPENAEAKATGQDAIDIDMLAQASAQTTDDKPYKLPELPDMSKDMITPNTIGARVRTMPTSKIEIWASGDRLWHGQACGIDVTLVHLAVSFCYTEQDFIKGTQDRKPPIYEGTLCGSLDFKNYTADAQLSIGPKRHATLMALLTEKDVKGDIKTFRAITDDIQKTGTDAGTVKPPAWDDIVPSFHDSLSFEHQSELFLFVDFSNKKVLAAATIKDFGGALLLGKEIVLDSTTKPIKTSRRYIFFLEARDMNRLFTETKEDVASQFNISRISVQAIGYDTTLEELRNEIKSITHEVEGDQEQNVKPLNAHTAAAPANLALNLYKDMPGDKALKVGTFFVAEITFGQAMRSPMTNVLALDASNTTGTEQPFVRLYARIVKKQKIKESDASKESVSQDPPASSTENEGGKEAPALTSKDETSVVKTSGDERIKDQTEYGIDIRNLEIFDGAVTINGAGRYYPDEKKLTLTADLAIQLAETQSLEFTVALTMDKDTTAFKVRLQTASTGSISNPLGGMFNVKLEGLRIEGSSTRKSGAPKGIERKCTIYGSAFLGDEGTSRLLGLIHFENGSPILVIVDFTRKIKENPPTNSNEQGTGSVPGDALSITEPRTAPLKISDIYRQIIQPNPGSDTPGSWPSEWEDFELLEAYMSYNKTDHSVKIDERTYAVGFYIYGSFKLFTLPVSVSLEINPKRKGFVLTGSYNAELDLGIIKFTKYTSTTANYPGLSLKIDTTQPKVSKRPLRHPLQIQLIISLHRLPTVWQVDSNSLVKKTCYSRSIIRIHRNTNSLARSSSTGIFSPSLSPRSSLRIRMANGVLMGGKSIARHSGNRG